MDTKNNIERYKRDFYALLCLDAILNRQIDIVNLSHTKPLPLLRS